MKCELCGTNFRKIETFLVCANGHTIQNTTFVANDNEELMFHPKGKKVRSKKSEKKHYRSSGCCMLKLILIKFIFEEARPFFNIKTDAVFKYFCSFFEFHYGKLVSCINVHQYTILGLIYLAKRSELEKEGKPCLFFDFIEQFKKFDLHSRLVLIKNRFPALTPVATDFIALPFKRYQIYYIKAFLERLTNSRLPTYPFKFNRMQDSGVYYDTIESGKHNLRSLVKNDYETIKPYFDDVCLFLGVQQTEDLVNYFKKYVYTFNRFTVMMPEYEIVIFLAMYFNHRDQFEDTLLEVKILDYIGHNKHYFMQVLKEKIRGLKGGVSPERFYHKFKKNGIHRFRNLRYAIEFVDVYKKLKMKSEKIDKEGEKENLSNQIE